MQRTFLNLLGAVLAALMIAPPAQGACPPPDRVVGVEPGRAVVFIEKAGLLIGLTGDIVGAVPPHHGTLEDLGDRFAYRPGNGFWTAGLDSFTLLLGSDARERPRAERVLLVPAVLSAFPIAEGFDGEAPSWVLEGSNIGLEIFSGWGVLSGTGSLRLLGSGGEPSWLAGVLDGHGGGQQGSTAQSTIRPPGGGGSGFAAGEPTELAVLEGIGASPASGFRVWLRDDGEALFLRLESAYASTSWLPLSRAEHRLLVTQWIAAADLERRSGAALWVDGAFLARIEAPAGDDSFRRAETLRVGVLAHQGPRDLTAEMDDLRFASLSLYPESVCQATDGFETGQPDPVWTAGGNVAVTPEAALDGGANGLAAVLGSFSSPDGGMLDASLPGNDPRLGVRFRFDPNSVGLPAGSQILLAEGVTSRGRRPFALLLEPTFSGYQLRLLAADDRGTSRVSPPVSIADAPQAVTLDWRRAVSQFADIGTLRLWIGGQLKLELTGIRNAAQDPHRIRVGAVAVAGGALGRVFVDQVEAVRGPLP
ncbi:MAG TPA: hypothetical protein VF789_03530 [Thermoanaerobaculia bacterium]